jgi:hypothetical protein
MISAKEKNEEKGLSFLVNPSSKSSIQNIQF